MAEITLAKFAADISANYDTVYRKAKRKFPLVGWTKETALSAEHIAALSGKTKPPRPAISAPAKRNPRTYASADFDSALAQDYIIRTDSTIPVHQPAPAVENTPTPGRAKIAWPSFGLSDFLALAVYGHTALVWYELWVIFRVPGILAGIVLFALKHAAVVICRSAKYDDYAADALGVAFVLDGLAVWVHYTAFGDAMPNRFKDGAEFWAALVLGLVVAAGAFVTLYFTNKTAKQ